MRSAEQLLADRLAAVPATESLVGVFVSQDGPVATVDVAGRRLLVKTATVLRVLPGDSVRLERRGPELVVSGPSASRSTLGRVAVAGDPATVEYPDGSGVTAALPVIDGVSVSVNDTVIIDWASGGTVLGVVTSPVTPSTPADPGTSGQTVTVKFTALQSGSYQSGRWWTDEVWASDNNTGGWFYGTKIKDTIPDTATILAAQMWLPSRYELGGADPNFGVHGSAVRPAGAVSFASSAALDPYSGLVSVPTAWIDTLKSADGGIGVNHGGYTIYRGLSADGRSGELTVTYQI